MKNIKFHITAMGDAGVFREGLLFCQYGLQALGYPVTVAHGQFDPDAINIVFGAHFNHPMASWTELSKKAPHLIVYNWEPASADIARFPARFIRLLQHTHVWDYSAHNVIELKNIAGVYDIHHVPMSYVPEMTTITSEIEQDIDVLFYGTMYERRRGVINALRAKGLHVVNTDDFGRLVLNEERDALIARAKVVLNMHSFDEAHVFEMTRVSYLLANHKAVVAEVSSKTDIDDDMRDAVLHGSLEELPQLCWDLVHNDTWRHELEQHGFDVFVRRNAAQTMRTAVDRYLIQSQAIPPQIGNPVNSHITMPTTLRIGCGEVATVMGEQWNYAQCNIDTRADYAADLVIDISQPLPFNQPLQSWRLGEVKLQRGYFKKIIAQYVFNRVTDFQMALTNCLELLVDGGEIHIIVPLDLSYDAWSTLGNKRLFNEKTWERILEDWWQYDWQESRLELIQSGSGIRNPLGYEWMTENNMNWEAAMTVPRIIDEIRIVLRKRLLTKEEKEQLPQARFMD